MSSRHTSSMIGDHQRSPTSFTSNGSDLGNRQNSSLSDSDIDNWLGSVPDHSVTSSSRALIRKPVSLDSTSFLTRISTIKEIVDIVKEGMCTPLLTKGLWREDRDGQGTRWLRVWSEVALTYLSTELRKIGLLVEKDGNEFVFAAPELLQIKALLKVLVKNTSPDKYQLQPKLPYPQAFPLLGSFQPPTLTEYKVTGKLSPIMALFALFRIKRVLYMKVTSYRDAVSDTVAYAQHSIDHSFSKLKHSVLSRWDLEDVGLQMGILGDLARLIQYLTDHTFREVETRSERLERILDENEKFSKWLNEDSRFVREAPVPRLELPRIGKLLCVSESSHSLAHFGSHRRRNMYQV
ncbi:hypothetical protein JCM5350_004150 [Sporobolomyces pararoseus]